jgi:hypothetical protein
MDQHSPEWWAARLGKVTASRIGDMMARNQPRKGQTVGDWSAKHNNYLREKVAERITGKPRDRKKVASLDHRLEIEPDARVAYEFYSDNPVVEVGFIEHPRIPNAGASPDGLVGSDGGQEIKCLDPENHIELITAGGIDQDYLYQCQFGMACTDRLWWDFVAFCPEMPEEGKLWVQRVDRDIILIAEIERNVIEFLTEVDQRVAQVQAIMRGSTPLETALESSLSSLHLVH